jgi:hypothetical protein
LGTTSTTVEVHTEEERARGMNLNGGRTGGVDLNGGRACGVDLDGGSGRCGTEEERAVRHERGGDRRGIEAHVEEERSVRCQRGGGRRGIMADVEEDRVPVGVWYGNDNSQG